MTEQQLAETIKEAIAEAAKHNMRTQYTSIYAMLLDIDSQFAKEWRGSWFRRIRRKIRHAFDRWRRRHDAAARKELERISPSNAQLREWAKKNPPPPEWHEQEEERPW